jgi:hypothetical protein
MTDVPALPNRKLIYRLEAGIHLTFADAALLRDLWWFDLAPA